MIIIIKPASPGKFEAYEGDRLLCVSRQPLLDAARVLLAEGADPDTPIAMRHVGADYDALTSTVGGAAKLIVTERDKGKKGPVFEPWRPFHRPDNSTVDTRRVGYAAKLRGKPAHSIPEGGR
jgi:hypothetical protein